MDCDIVLHQYCFPYVTLEARIENVEVIEAGHHYRDTSITYFGNRFVLRASADGRPLRAPTNLGPLRHFCEQSRCIDYWRFCEPETNEDFTCHFALRDDGQISAYLTVIQGRAHEFGIQPMRLGNVICEACTPDVGFLRHGDTSPVVTIAKINISLSGTYSGRSIAPH